MVEGTPPSLLPVQAVLSIGDMPEIKFRVRYGYVILKNTKESFFLVYRSGDMPEKI